MPDRYYVETSLASTPLRLSGVEAHHLAHVMRAKPGDQVTLFDGSGAEALARVERVGRAEIELTLLSRSEVNRELSTAVTLGVALPKGDRQRWLVEKAVELGVARLAPLATQHSTESSSRTSLDRLRRAVIEASKQCGRNQLMEILAVQALSDYLASAPADSIRLLAHPIAPAAAQVIDELPANVAAGQFFLAVGPEGGFTDVEIELAQQHGWRVVNLGSRILRVETAALALATLVMLRCG